MKTVTAAANRLGNRSSNQDRILVVETPEQSLIAVADGMGGHDRGDIAAQAAVDSLREHFLEQKEPVENPRQFLENALRKAHFAVVDAGNRQKPAITPRTTCVVCLVQRNHAWWAHIGDSRLYLIRKKKLFLRTRDHTPVEELLQQGLIKEQDLRDHPMRNSVNRCLGGTRPPARISFNHSPLESDDLFLLCSDGLWSTLPEDRMTGFTDFSNLDDEINRLADEAERASYPHSDNISLVALHWVSAGDEPEAHTAKTDNSPGTATDTQRDPVQQAIDDIHRAMLEYASEMKK